MTRSKNGGFTLLELLVIIVIMGIVASFTYLSVSNVGASAAREAATDTEYLLSRCRSACLSRSGESYVWLKLSDNDNEPVAEYYEDGKLQETRELGKSRVKCRLGNDTLSPLTEEGTKISFQRSSGAQKETGEYARVETIEFSGGGAVYKVIIVPGTGSHRVE